MISHAPNYPRLIGICGHAGSGKDSAAEAIISSFSYRRYAFADAVKETAAAAFGISVEQFNRRNLKETPLPYWKKSPREIAQFVGTELFRDAIQKLLPDVGTDFWIRRLEMQLFLDFPSLSEVKVVIPDVRFTNEAEWIVANGGVIIDLTRPGYHGTVGIENHPSETTLELSKYPRESVLPLLNCGTLKELQTAASFVIQQYALRSMKYQ